MQSAAAVAADNDGDGFFLITSVRTMYSAEPGELKLRTVSAGQATVPS